MPIQIFILFEFRADILIWVLVHHYQVVHSTSRIATLKQLQAVVNSHISFSIYIPSFPCLPPPPLPQTPSAVTVNDDVITTQKTYQHDHLHLLYRNVYYLP